MRRQQLRQPLRLAGAALAAVTLLLSTPAWAGSAESTPAGPTPAASPATSTVQAADTARPTPMQHGPMMELSEHWKQMDARLDRLVEQMNRATGAAKVDAMAAVISELVSQREQMHRMLGQMRRDARMHGMTQPAHNDMMERGGLGAAPSGSAADAARMCVRPAPQVSASSASGSSS